MPARERSFTTETPKGTSGRFGSVFGGYPVYSGSNFCGDIVGSGDNAPLTVQHHQYEGGRINRPYQGFFTQYFDNYRCDLLDNSSYFGHLGVAESPSDIGAATNAAARTNPSRPYVDVPANLLEIGDLAHLIKRKIDPNGSVVPEIGRQHLRRVFGIEPVYRDLQRLANFQQQVSRRVAEIHRLAAPRGLRKTVSIGRYSAQEVQSLIVQSEGLFLGRDFNVNTTEEVKCHCRWLPNIDFASLATPAVMDAWARRSVLGVTVDFSTLWEPMPWSWLIDWAFNVGDYFKANRNIVPAVLSDVSIMRHTTTTAHSEAVSGDDWSLEAISSFRETKKRSTSFVSLDAHFPFLTGSQMGIVAALAVTRR